MDPIKGIEPSKTKLRDGFIMGCCVVLLIWILFAMFGGNEQCEDCIAKRPDTSNRTLLSPGHHIIPKIPFLYTADSRYACVLIEHEFSADMECFELVHIHQNHVGVIFNRVTGKIMDEVLQPGVYRIDLGVLDVTHIPLSDYTTIWKEKNNDANGN